MPIVEFPVLNYIMIKHLWLCALLIVSTTLALSTSRRAYVDDDESSTGCFGGLCGLLGRRKANDESVPYESITVRSKPSKPKVPIKRRILSVFKRSPKSEARPVLSRSTEASYDGVSTEVNRRYRNDMERQLNAKIAGW